MPLLGRGRPDLSLHDRSRTADEETDDIDEQGSNGQHAEQQRLREDDAKEGIQRIVSGSYESDNQARGEQLERQVQAMIPVPENVVPMNLDIRNEHRVHIP